MNAVEIEEAISDLALQPFDAVEFPFAFLAAFGNKDTALKRLRTGNNNASDVPGGVLQRNNIHIAVCEAGTVGESLKALRASPATTKAKAKFILATDGQTLEAEELAGGETIACAYPDFPNHFGFFLPLAGISTIKEIRDNPIDVRATARLNKLYVELLNENPEWAKDERRADMNHFMARLVFCFFAEDTDIFNGTGLFTQSIEQMSERDGSNTHEVMQSIFRAMNIKVAERANAEPRLPNWANGFPYVNGGLFSGSTEVPRFTRMARSYLIHAGNLNWQQINPDIFGSMIQAVADDEERGSLGMHYTSVPNILKVLNPLFLDDLRAVLNEAGDNKIKLLNLRKRMARIGDDPADQSDITVLRHVRSSVEKRAAEEIADRTSCKDFDKFQPLFERVEREMKAGIRKTLRFGGDASIASGSYFIVGGQLAYVAEIGEMTKTQSGHDDARLRVIYNNGTESNLLMRSLQKALFKDETGRRLTDPDMGPLFGDAPEPDDIETGTIYVLRSLSSEPFVAEHRELIHKIGVTGGKVETRIAGAEKDATYLLAEVEVVAEYKLHNLNRTKLENIFHRLFGAAQLDLTIEDRFGHPVKPREWFLVPLNVIDEAVQRIRDGSITEVTYDPKTARLEG